jgi:hypothetical protein
MAVAVTALAHASSGGSVASQTLSVTATTDPLYVFVWLNSASRSLLTCLYGAAVMTRIARQTGGSWAAELWALDAPSAGTANVVATPDSSCQLWLGAVKVTGSILPSELDQTPAYASGSSTAPTVANANSRTGDLVVGMVASAITSQTFTDAGGQTNIFSDTAANTNNHASLSTAPGAASVTMAWTLGTTGAWGIFTISLPDVSGSPSGVRTSQVAIEDVSAGTQQARVSQLVVEDVSAGTQGVRVGQMVIEAVTPSAPSAARVGQVAIEDVSAGTKEVRVGQFCIEIVRPIKITTYKIKGHYSGSGNFAAGDGQGTLTVRR